MIAFIGSLNKQLLALSVNRGCFGGQFINVLLRAVFTGDFFYLEAKNRGRFKQVGVGFLDTFFYMKIGVGFSPAAVAWIVRVLFSHSVEEYVLGISGSNPV